jgi:hypothetical protein
MRRFKGNRSNRKLRKDSRTIPLWGSLDRGGGEDHQKWYECWFCGWRCNVERDALGDGQSRSGVVHEDYNPTENTVTRNMGVGASGDTTTTNILEPQRSIYSTLTENQAYNEAVLGGDINSFQVAGENDSEGDTKSVRHPIRVSDKSRGCPFCHSMNWRGDY